MSSQFVKELLQKDCDLTPSKGKSGLTHRRKVLGKPVRYSATVYTLHLPKIKQDY